MSFEELSADLHMLRDQEHLHKLIIDAQTETRIEYRWLKKLLDLVEKYSPYKYVKDLGRQLKRFENDFRNLLNMLSPYNIRLEDLPKNDKDLFLFHALLTSYVRAYTKTSHSIEFVELQEHFEVIFDYFKVVDKKYAAYMEEQIEFVSDDQIKLQLELLKDKDLDIRKKVLTGTYNIDDKLALQLLHTYSYRKKDKQKFSRLTRRIRRTWVELLINDAVVVLYEHNKSNPVFTPFLIQFDKFIKSLKRPNHRNISENLNDILSKFTVILHSLAYIKKIATRNSLIVKRIHRHQEKLTAFFIDSIHQAQVIKHLKKSPEADDLYKASFQIAQIFDKKIGRLNIFAAEIWREMKDAARNFSSMASFDAKNKFMLLLREYGTVSEGLGEIEDLLRLERVKEGELLKKAKKPKPNRRPVQLLSERIIAHSPTKAAKPVVKKPIPDTDTIEPIAENNP